MVVTPGSSHPLIERMQALVVPTISLYEVFKRVLQQRDESQALRAVAMMQQDLSQTSRRRSL